jgi:hypothetical protein
MSRQSALLKGFLGFFAVAFAVISCPREGRAQALLVEQLSGGTHLVLVTQPLANATTLVWPTPDAENPEAIQSLVAGRLTLAADVEAAFAVPPESEVPQIAPSVIVAVGGVPASELSALLDRLIGDRSPAPTIHRGPAALAEGGLDRRLGPPGSDGLLRLEVSMPPPDDQRRSSVEVLWDLLPELLSEIAVALQSRVDGDRGVLEARVDADLAEVTVRDIRLNLARFASDPKLRADAVDEARRRLGVRRQAMLSEHPEAAEKILALWTLGGEEAVREFLFGVDGVTLDSVRSAAESWLPHHPGRAQLMLPPRVFNPRFAMGPQMVQLDNDLAAAVLERSAAPLAVVCLRPVMVPDPDGAVTATVLARLARELRLADGRPGWIRLRTSPPLLEVAGPADGFGELMEQLTSAYARVATDRSPVTVDGVDARRRALDLMAGVLGLAEGGDPSPASLLRPGNLALGVVAPDAEAALEALHKFWTVESGRSDTADVQNLASVERTRVAAPGGESVLVVALELPFAGDEAVSSVVRELLKTRALALWPDLSSAVVRPFVPGRALLLLEVAGEGTIDEIEDRVREQWPELTRPVSEEELGPVKRRVAAATSAEMSGAAGHARRCAATAAGDLAWHQPAEFELEILTQSPEGVSEVLTGFGDWAGLETTGAGVLPITDLERR